MPDPSVAPQGGALSGGFTPGYTPTTPPLTAAATQPGVDFASLVQRFGPDQAVAMAPSYGITIDPSYLRDLSNQGKELIGAGGGPLSQQIQTVQTNEQKAAQAKMDAINQAMAVLNAQKSGQTTNLPLLAAGAAMLAPTRTGAFTESLSNALGASLPQIEQQRQRDLEAAKLQGTMGIAGADVQGELAKEQADDFWKRIGLGENDLKYAAASGARLEANANTNNTRVLTTGMNDQTRVQTNQNTVDAKDRATVARSAYETAVIDARNRGLTDRETNNQAMLAIRQQLADQAGGKIADSEWNDYQSRVTANMNAITKTMPGMNMSADDLRAKAIEMTVPPAITGKNPTPKAPPAPAQRQPAAQPQAGAKPTKPSLDDIFATAPAQP